ncbi:FAD-binding oxidoreductase [Streptomyces sp. NPDC088729]|uniref:FAD-binding oxidoreductase n=1 Tax=Streptomyces sp. NPDC088729 TaxID=3365876 RepID=UPI0037F45431
MTGIGEGAGGPAAFSSAEVRRLQRQVAGAILLPGDDGYEAEKNGFERSLEHRPAVVVAARGPDDVVAAVRWAGEQGLGVAVQATGHGTCVAADRDSVLVTTTRMSDVRVDAGARVAHVGAGARWADVIEPAADHGLVPLSGAAPGVGAVSYLLGGGLGLLSRRFGSPADHVRSLRVVTADGRTTEASPRSRPDLFWGLRGSRGNLGIVVSASIDLFPVDEFFGGGLFFDGAHTRAVLASYAEWVRTAPDSLCTSLCLLRFPPIPEIPDFLRGRFVVHVRVAYTGPASAARPLLQPLREAAPLLQDTTAPMSYRLSGSIHNDPTTPMATVSRTMMLRNVDQAALQVIEELAGPAAEAPFMLELRHMQGALAREATSSGAVGYYPEAEYNLFLLAPAEPHGDLGLTERLEDRVTSSLGPWAAPGKVSNFLIGPQSEADIRSTYSGPTYEKLRKLKREFDPANMFRYNLNIPPAPDP